MNKRLGGKELISIHSLLAEGDVFYACKCPPAKIISIHSLLAEGDANRFDVVFCANISIHSLLAEGDNGANWTRNVDGISIHSLLAEGDPADRGAHRDPLEFQSTPSSRRETRWPRSDGR